MSEYTCQRCNGAGKRDGFYNKACYQCMGTGEDRSTPGSTAFAKEVATTIKAARHKGEVVFTRGFELWLRATGVVSWDALGKMKHDELTEVPLLGETSVTRLRNVLIRAGKPAPMPPESAPPPPRASEEDIRAAVHLLWDVYNAPQKAEDEAWKAQARRLLVNYPEAR